MFLDSYDNLFVSVFFFQIEMKKAWVYVKKYNNLQVIDALELAFQELDSEDSMDDSKAMDDSKVKESETKTESVTDKVETLIDFGTDSKTPVAPLYENIDIFYQNSVDEAGAFPLDLPTNVLEPPKEKPPPPPTDDSPDDELLGNVSFFIS